MALHTKTKKDFFYKLTITVSVFLFTLQPIAPVFANTYTYDYNNRLTSTTNTTTGAVTTYAYDANGQRVKMTVIDPNKGINTTTYYASKYYEETYDNNNPSTPPKIVKHIFANGVEIQTVFGTGKDAKAYSTITDHLGNVTGLVDSAGNLVESIDYYPFGTIRTDTRIDPTVPSSPNKFLDQKYDDQTGLNYLNSRYYNSKMGKFLSQDPTARDITEKFLSDPQQLNFYSYARNNPIILSDPSGLETDVTGKPLDLPGLGLVYAHSFTTVNPNQGEVLYMDYNNICQQITKPITFGGYLDKGWQFNLKAGEPGDMATYQKQADTAMPHVATIKVDANREGMTNQQLDQNVINTFVATPKNQGLYDPPGGKVFVPNSNCHNFTTYLLEKSGVSQQQTNEIGKKLSSDTSRRFPGFGAPMGSPSVFQTAAQKIANTYNSASTATSNIINKILNR